MSNRLKRGSSGSSESWRIGNWQVVTRLFGHDLVLAADDPPLLDAPGDCHLPPDSAEAVLNRVLVMPFGER